MTQEELAQLIEACKAKDPPSQKRLYQHFFNYGMTVCSRYASDREEAREILNDSFVKVFFGLDKYDPQRSFKGWINRIMVNTAIDYFRKRQSQPRVVDIVYAQHAETSAQAVSNLSAQELLAMVQKLSPAYRMVFSLHVIEGYKHEEIAKKLGITAGTSKSNLAKARVKLKAMISQQADKMNKYG